MCNRRLYRLLAEKEHESVRTCFFEMEQRAEEAVISAKEHLEERNEEPPSIVSGSVVSSRQSSKARTHKTLDRACELRRQAAEFASLKIDQAKEEVARRECEENVQRELEEMLEATTKQKERLRQQSEERSRLQHSKDVNTQVQFEGKLSEINSRATNDLLERLRDFDDEKIEPEHYRYTYGERGTDINLEM